MKHCTKCDYIEPSEGDEVFACDCPRGLKIDLDKTVQEIEFFLATHGFSDHYKRSMGKNADGNSSTRDSNRGN